MSDIAATIRDWRRSETALSDISFVAETDPDASQVAWPRSLISVDLAPSETNAGVPIRVTEEIIANAELGAGTLPGIAQRIIRATNGRSHYSTTVTIHRLTLESKSYDSDFGTALRCTLTWSGEASWRPE